MVDMAEPHKPYRYKHGWIPVAPGEVKSPNPFYNTVPETRGISRTKSTYEHGGGTGLGREDAAKLEAFRRQQAAAAPIKRSDLSNPNTPRSREVTPEEFAAEAKRGAAKYAALKAAGSEPRALEGESWQRIKDHAFTQTRKPWGGVTIDAHSGEEVKANADAYAVTVRDEGMGSVGIDAHAPRAEFDKAMEEAKRRFAAILRRKDHHLGVFYDADLGRIEIDPVLVSGSRLDAEQIGAHTRALGGAYHFKSGDGYWPPHVKG